MADVWGLVIHDRRGTPSFTLFANVSGSGMGGSEGTGSPQSPATTVKLAFSRSAVREDGPTRTP
jgi:hypothetical protein